jgi:PIN domain nuclease of toxin-antitoxin system
MSPALLLDTHTALWLDSGAPMLPFARQAIDEAAVHGNVYASPISAWEIGQLVARGRLKLNPPDANAWFDRFLASPGIRLVPLTTSAAIGSSFLPGQFHPDPADRLLVATARELDVPIVTRDRKILDYAKTGAVKAIAC